MASRTVTPTCPVSCSTASMTVSTRSRMTTASTFTISNASRLDHEKSPRSNAPEASTPLLADFSAGEEGRTIARSQDGRKNGVGEGWVEPLTTSDAFRSLRESNAQPADKPVVSWQAYCAHSCALAGVHSFRLRRLAEEERGGDPYPHVRPHLEGGRPEVDARSATPRSHRRPR